MIILNFRRFIKYYRFDGEIYIRILLLIPHIIYLIPKMSGRLGFFINEINLVNIVNAKINNGDKVNICIVDCTLSLINQL